MQWAAYRRKWGPLNPMARSDAGFALVASLLCTAHGIRGSDGGRLTQASFMPYPIQENTEEFTPERAVLLFKNLAGRTKASKKKGKK